MGDFLSRSVFADVLLQGNFQVNLYFQAKQAVRLQISVRVKRSKNRVQDQVYSKDLGNLFYSGIFRPRGCQDGSVCLVVKREEPQTMCILVSRVDSLS